MLRLQGLWCWASASGFGSRPVGPLGFEGPGLGLGFRVWGLGVEGLGFELQGLGLGFRVEV